MDFSMTRRAFVPFALTAAATVALAGCSAGSDDDAAADGHPRQNDRIRTDEHIVADMDTGDFCIAGSKLRACVVQENPCIADDDAIADAQQAQIVRIDPSAADADIVSHRGAQTPQVIRCQRLQSELFAKHMDQAHAQSPFIIKHVLCFGHVLPGLHLPYAATAHHGASLPG